MLTTLARTLLLLTILALPVAALAQHPLVGAWQETQIGFLVTFDQQPDGRLTGTLQGQAGPMPLNIVSDLRGAQGSFLLDGQAVGFAAELQPNDSVLLIWLFEFDAAGQPIQDSYEQYMAFPAQPALPSPSPSPLPSGGLPLPPPLVAPGSNLEPQQGGIAGTWRADGQFDDGTPYLVELKLDVGSTWRMDLVVEGQPFAYFGGPYTFSPDGILRYQETNRSPQVCYQGECQENSIPDSSGADQVHFLDANTMVTTDAQSGEQTVYSRVAGVGLPQVPGSGFPGAVAPMVPPAAGGFPPPPPAAGGFPPPPPVAGGFPPLPPVAGGFPPAPPVAGGFPPPPPVAGGFPPASAATPPGGLNQAAPVLASDFIGVWESEQKLSETVTLSLVSSFGADGSWRLDFSHQGIPVAFYEGVFAVSPEGVLRLQVNSRSPQSCFQGNCVPTKDTDIIPTGQVTFLTPDSFESVGVNSKGEEVRLSQRRSGRNGM